MLGKKGCGLLLDAGLCDFAHDVCVDYRRRRELSYQGPGSILNQPYSIHIRGIDGALLKLGDVDGETRNNSNRMNYEAYIDAPTGSVHFCPLKED